MDKIFVNDLKVMTKVGVLAWEQEIDQPIVISLEVSQSFKKLNDRIENTFDYSRVYEKINNYCKSNQHKLLETLAEKLAELILQEDKIEKVKLTLTKPAALAETQQVGVRIERSK